MAAAAPTLNIAEGQEDQRVRGLDTLRFFLAMWVVFSHFGLVPLGLDQSNLAGKIVTVIYDLLCSGAAAVIVFFVISGFCIHYPYRNGKELRLVPYFARRHLRIWAPIFAAVLIANPLNVHLTVFQESILWSLIAEEIYYLIYPGLLYVKKRFGWSKILLVSYFGALMVIMQDPSAGNYPSYGPYLNWILGLPCWLLGCCLAERMDAQKNATLHAPIQIPIWRWRFAAWFLSCASSVLRFHSPVKYPWTLTLFAIFAFFWLEQEIAYYRSNRPAPVFENAGKASYSIYLVHLLGPALYAYWQLPKLGPATGWTVNIAFTLLLCYVFYIVVERPSHLWARKLARKLSPRQSPSVTHAEATI